MSREAQRSYSLFKRESRTLYDTSTTSSINNEFEEKSRINIDVKQAPGTGSEPVAAVAGAAQFSTRASSELPVNVDVDPLIGSSSTQSGDTGGSEEVDNGDAEVDLDVNQSDSEIEFTNLPHAYSLDMWLA